MDTVIDHQHIKRMVQAGFTEEQAEAIASGITDRLATKADIDRLEGKLDQVREGVTWLKWVTGLLVVVVLFLAGFHVS